MSLKFLTQPWLDRYVELSASLLPRLEGVNLMLEIEVTGGPNGDVVLFSSFVQGQMVAAGLGRAPAEPALRLRIPFDLHRATERNELVLADKLATGEVSVDGGIGDLQTLGLVTDSRPFWLLRDKIKAEVVW